MKFFYLMLSNDASLHNLLISSHLMCQFTHFTIYINVNCVRSIDQLELKVLKITSH